MTSPPASFVDRTCTSRLSCHLHTCTPASFVHLTYSLLEGGERHRLREFATSCARRTAQVLVCLQQVFCQVYRSEKVVRKHVVVAQKMVPQQFHRDTISKIEVDRRVSLGACVNVECNAVSRVRVTQAPQLYPSLSRLLRHVLFERQSDALTVHGSWRRQWLECAKAHTIRLSCDTKQAKYAQICSSNTIICLCCMSIVIG